MRLVHGNAFSLLESLADNSVDCVLSDPPYDFNEQGKAKLVAECLRVSKGPVLLFCPPENQFDNAECYLFWIKPISTKNTSRRYSRFVEMICLYQHDTWNPDRHWSQYTNVFTDLVDGETAHPYEKPKSLIRRLVLNHTNPDGLVLDPFMGSGTTGVVCQEVGRDFMGSEMDATYYQLAESRIGSVPFQSRN